MSEPLGTTTTGSHVRRPLSATPTAPGLLRDFLDFVYCNKLWWLAPIAMMLLGVASLLFLAHDGVAPFTITMSR